MNKLDLDVGEQVTYYNQKVTIVGFTSDETPIGESADADIILLNIGKEIALVPKMMSGFVNYYSNTVPSNHASADEANTFVKERPSLQRTALIDLSQFPIGHGL